MKKQDITPEQYYRANRVMSLILTISYTIYILIELNGMNQRGVSLAPILRCVLYLIMMAGDGLILKICPRNRAGMLYLAMTYAVTYAVMIFGNGAASMMLVFPVIVGFMVYLNSRMVLVGCVYAIFICIIKTILIKMSGDTQTFQQATLAIMGLILCTYGSFRAITLLIDFSKEDQEIIIKEADRKSVV